jgi:hypothetical protein
MYSKATTRYKESTKTKGILLKLDMETALP